MLQKGDNMKYKESTLQGWTEPLSDSEKERVENTRMMIADAIRNDDELSKLDYQIFAQGSYANNTNVRQNSDVDICVMLTSSFFSCYVSGMSGADFGFGKGGMTSQDFRDLVLHALEAKFGAQNVTLQKKCIDIKANTYHVNADVIPSLQYRNYKAINSNDKDKYVEGIKYFSLSGEEVINYPKSHIYNGKQKNNETNHKYKKLVRIFKHIREEMNTEGLIDEDKITSFLIECLVWNVPNQYILLDESWNNTVKNSIMYLLNAIRDGNVLKWCEVSGWISLFEDRKWTITDVENYLRRMYLFMEL